MAINSVIHTNQHSIDRVLKAGVPVVLVFWTRNVEPSAPVTALLEQTASQHAGKLLIAKVDAGEEKPIAQRFHIQQAPALVFVKQGQVEGTLAGDIQPRDLQAWFTYLVQGGAKPATTGGAAGSTRAHASTNGHGPRGQTANGTGGKPVTLTDANFQQVINGPQPVLVDFWAAWCGPCRMVAPAVEQLAQQFQGRAVVGKLNVDENAQTAQRYQIMGIPALYIFKNGKVVDQLVGVQPVQVLQQRLARYVN